MIISASRRTDIPALYVPWFMNRLKEGFVLIPNQRNPSCISKVRLSPAWVDCFVFWTKNPFPMLDKFSSIIEMGYQILVQFTLTPYGQSIEPHLPPKKTLVRAFRMLAGILGYGQVIWRYDPIFLDAEHTIAWHEKQFGDLAKELASCTDRCIISFMDIYRFNRNLYSALTAEEINGVAERLGAIAQKYGLPLFTCAEESDLSRYGIKHSSCIDPLIIARLLGMSLNAAKDKAQRPACGCIESVDIGAYNTCAHGCTYCYATTNRQTAMHRYTTHDPTAPMLTGYPCGDETIIDHTAPSMKEKQVNLFDY